MKLRDYQQPVVDQLYDAWWRVRSVLVVIATGGGKTVVFCHVVAKHDGYAVVVVHRKEILRQISVTLARFGVRHRVIGSANTVRSIRRKHVKEFGRSYVDDNAIIAVASAQTLSSKRARASGSLSKFLALCTLGVFDEGHHYIQGGSWGSTPELLPDTCKLLFVSASPERADGKGLGSHASGYVDEMILGPSTRWLIDQGYLKPIKHYTPPGGVDYDGVPVTAKGELNTREMRKRIADSQLVGNVVEHHAKFSNGWPTIVFANDVETSNELADQFGGAAVALDGGSDPLHRERAMDEFGERGGVIVNVDLFDEGVDISGVAVVVMARKTLSLSKYLQQGGRALRPVYAEGRDLSSAEGRKAAIAASPLPHAIIIDAVGNYDQHMGLDWPRSWSLDDAESGERAAPSDTVPQYTCLGCSQPYPKFLTACPHCGAEPPEPAGRAAPEAVAGDLVLLDDTVLHKLVDKARRANLQGDEYAAEQIRRAVPRIGRAKDQRHQAERLTERHALRVVVDSWARLHSRLTERELDKLFYIVSGCDKHTAFTLNAKDTAALTARITNNMTRGLTT